MNVQHHPAPVEAASAPVTAPGAIVLGGAHGSLAVVRSLGRHGIPVCVITADHPIARMSRYATYALSWPGVADPGALDFLLRLAGGGSGPDLTGWLIFTGGDADAEFVARHQAELSAVFRLTGPDWQTARYALDKNLTYRRAAELGLATPLTYTPKNRAEVATLDCRFPVVLKPAVKDRPNAFTLAKAWRVDDREALIARYDQAASLVGEDAVVLQELIPGDGSNQFSYAAAWYRGARLASLVARRTRQYPVDFGYTSTYVETIEQPEVEKAAVRFLASLDFTGLVEIEFKYDRRDQRYKLLDVNARAWTWIGLGATAGTDFPWLLWQAENGLNVPPATARTGAAWTHTARDFVALLQQMPADGDGPRPARSPARGPLTYAAFAADDPFPGIADLPVTLWRALRTRLPLALRAVGRHRPAPVASQPAAPIETKSTEPTAPVL